MARNMLLQTKVLAPSKTRIAVRHSLVMAIGIVSASVLISTFLAAILSPLTVKSLATKPATASILTISLNADTAPSKNIPRFVRDFSFLTLDFKNSSDQKLTIKSLVFNKLGNLADSSVGDLKLYINNQLIANSSLVKAGKVYFEDIRGFDLEAFGVQTLNIKATVLSPGSRPESRVGFALKSSDVDIIPVEIKKYFLTEEVKGNLMNVVSQTD